MKQRQTVRRWAIVGSLLLLGAALVWLMASNTLQPMSAPAESRGLLDIENGAIASDEAIRLRQRSLSGAPGAVPSLPTSPDALLQGGWRASDLLSELTKAAHAGDAKAMASLKNMLVLCIVFAPEERPYGEGVPRLSGLKPGHPLRSARESGLRLFAQFCDLSLGKDATRQLLNDTNAQLAEAQARGDVVARAEGLFRGEGDVEITAIYLETDDPWVAEKALTALAKSRGPLAGMLRRKAFDHTAFIADEQREQRIMAAAARWRGCDLGGSCGPNHPLDTTMCVMTGNCLPGADVRTHIRQRELSAWEFELMLYYLEVLDAQFTRGG